MEKVREIMYRCSICGEKYTTEDEALECESKPITKDKGVKAGDIVLITGGQGKGCRAKVTRTWIASKYWGHYAWKRYWHTVNVVADLVSSRGTRTLTFDQYGIETQSR